MATAQHAFEVFIREDVREMAPHRNYEEVTYIRLMGMGIDAAR